MSVGPDIGFLNIPPLQPVRSTPGLAALETRIRRLSERSPNFVSTFGLELRAGTVMAVGGDPTSRRILQRLLSRPAAEAVLLHAWPKLVEPSIELEAMRGLASGLAAKPLTLARGRMRTTSGPDGGYTVYAPVEHRQALPTYLAETRAAAPDHPLATALTVFALTILTHPLTDGNGRLGRALLHGSLAQSGLVQAPVLPLAPAFYAKAGVVRGALRTLSDTGDWAGSVELLSQIIALACDLADRTEKLVAVPTGTSPRRDLSAQP